MLKSSFILLTRCFTVFILLVLPTLAFTQDENADQTQHATFELRQAGDIYIPFQNGIPYPSWERQERQHIDLSGVWKSERQKADHSLTLLKRTPECISSLEQEGAGRSGATYDDSGWPDKTVPGVDNPAPDRYQDGIWYRRSFKVPATAAGKYVKLMFEGANYFADVWLNGRWIGCHEGGYTPFAFDVSEYLNYGSENTIAVRVDNIPWLPNGDNSPEALKTNDHNIIPYATCDWWNYGGITRDVYLEIAPAASIVRADVKCGQISEKDTELDIAVTLINKSASAVDTQVSLKVFPAAIKDKNIEETSINEIASRRAIPVRGDSIEQVSIGPGEVKALRFKLEAKKIKTWSPESPELYVLQVNLGDKKDKLDEFYTQFGVRSISIDKSAAKLLLNGEPVFLRGIARHEIFRGESGVEDYSGSRIMADLRLLKEANANFVRTGHYPNQQDTYLFTDRLGLLVWEEIPAYWFGGPEFMLQKNVRGIARQMWLEMIYRDFNRPSIIIWGTCNECGWQKERAEFIKDLRDNAYKVDGTRLVAQSAAGNDPTDPTQKECDVAGFTTYQGVFYGGSYFSDTMEALEKTHKAFPEKPIISTEYGIWAPYGDYSQENIQIEVAKETFGAFRELPYVCGATWWAGFDWHTMINEPQNMGTVTMDRKSLKPVYFQLQKQYASLLGDISVSLKIPEEEQTLQGKTMVTAEVKGSERPDIVELIVDDKVMGKLSSRKGLYSIDFDTSKVPDGNHTFIVRAKGRKGGYYVSDFARVKVDNIDEPPVIDISVKDGDIAMGKMLLAAVVSDDRCTPKVTLSIDGLEPAEMTFLGNGNFQTTWDVAGFPDGSQHELKFTAIDSGDHAVEVKAAVTIDNRPGQYVELPYDHDWISTNRNYSDGTGWDYPAEDLPASNSEFVYNGEERVKFRFGDKSDGARNCVEGGKQTISFPAGYYDKVHILASMRNGGSKVPFMLNYTDGTQQKVMAGFSDWWGGNPVFGEKLVIKTTHHHERSGERKPGAGIYMQTIEPEKGKILSSITLPAESRFHLFAVTLEGEVSYDAVPEPTIIEPRGNSSVGDTVKIIVGDKEDDIAKMEYAIDDDEWNIMPPSGSGTFTAEWDTMKAAGIRHTISVKATDKIGQINIKTIDVRVVNKVTIIFPFDGASIYKKANIMVEPRANKEVDKIEFQVDSAQFMPMSLSNMGLYTAEWDTGGYKPGTSHILTVREYDKAGGVTVDTVKVTADSVKVSIAEPVKGHSIKVDKNVRDWVGVAPEQENTATVSNGEFIWKDAKDDDTGNGRYAYPTNKAAKKGSDLKEFRVTWDKDNLYFMIKCDRPGEFWVPYRIIGIDTDGAKGGKKGTQTLAQGDMDEVDPDKGCFGEIRVSPELACEYIVGVYNSYKGRIWDAKGKLLAWKEAKEDDTPGFEVDDSNWASVEVAIPWKILGGVPYGQTWRFVVGIGQQDNDIFREIEKEASEWHSGGGETSDMFGPDPDIFDLASPDKKTQEFELRSYDPEGEPGNPEGFATIKKSYLVVTFSEERPKK